MSDKGINQLNELDCLRLLVAAYFGTSGTPSTSPSGIVASKGTYTTVHVANNANAVVPQSARRWAVNFYGTGTGNTFGTDTAVTAPCSFSDNASPATAIPVACDGSSTATIFYSTT